jgi:hypothetical protein
VINLKKGQRGNYTYVVLDVVERLKGRRCELETPTKTDYLRADNRYMRKTVSGRVAAREIQVEGIEIWENSINPTRRVN